MTTIEELSREAGSLGPTMFEMAKALGLAFGSAIIGPSDLTDANYMALLLSQSDSCVVGAYPKQLQPSQGQFTLGYAQSTIAAADWREKLAHVLIYPNNMPAWMDAAFSSENWQTLLYDHLVGVQPVFSLCNRIMVTNEMINGNGMYWTNALCTAAGSGLAAMTYLFQAAREIFPNAKLFYSDSGCERDINGLKRAGIVSLIDSLLQLSVGGQPVINGVCLQGHLSATFAFSGIPYAAFLHDLISVRGLEVCVSEADFRIQTNTTVEATAFMAARQVGTLMDAALSEGVSWWNFWGIRNDKSWLNGVEPGYAQYPLPFDSNGNPTPMERALRRIMQHSLA